MKEVLKEEKKRVSSASSEADFVGRNSTSLNIRRPMS